MGPDQKFKVASLASLRHQLFHIIAVVFRCVTSSTFCSTFLLAIRLQSEYFFVIADASAKEVYFHVFGDILFVGILLLYFSAPV